MPCLSSFSGSQITTAAFALPFSQSPRFSTQKGEGRALLPLCPEGVAALTEIGEFCPQ